jgi:hypothetical protein
MDILKWILRWFLWLPLVSRNLGECGELYVAGVAAAAAVTLGVPGGLGYALLWEYNNTHQLFMPLGWYVLGSVFLYLLVGLVFYFLWPNTNYGKWHKRGAW